MAVAGFILLLCAVCAAKPATPEEACVVGPGGPSDCQDDASLAQLRRLQMHIPKKGHSYRRPRGAAPALPLKALLHQVPDYDEDTTGAPLPFGVASKCSKKPCSSQVHIHLSGVGEVVVSFAANITTETPSRVEYGELGKGRKHVAHGDYRTYSAQIYYGSDWLWGESPLPGPISTHPVVDEVASQLSTDDWAFYGRDPQKHVPGIWKVRDVKWVEDNINYPGMFGDYYNPKDAYTSPQIHKVKLTGLKPGTTYTYQVSNLGTVFNFTMPRGEVAGRAGASNALYPFTFGLFSDIGQTAVSAYSMKTMLHLKPDVVLVAGDLSYADGYYYRWDTFGNLLQPLGARIPLMTCPGNHEYGNGENFQSYNIRYPMPFRQSGSPNPNFWSRDIGPAHVVSLNSYASSQPGSEQYLWLQRDLQSFSRKKTPWLIVLMHAPFYNSNIHHLMEAKVMRDNLEGIFFGHHVNVVMAGHVHAFEATKPTYRNKTDECGPTYLNTGDSGNYEGINLGWLDGDEPGKPPAWSAFRESSFGVGTLALESARKGVYTWRRNYCYDQETQKPNYTKHCATPGDTSANAHAPKYTVSIANTAYLQRCHHS